MVMLSEYYIYCYYIIILHINVFYYYKANSEADSSVIDTMSTPFFRPIRQHCRHVNKLFPIPDWPHGISRQNCTRRTALKDKVRLTL